MAGGVVVVVAHATTKNECAFVRNKEGSSPAQRGQRSAGRPMRSFLFAEEKTRPLPSKHPRPKVGNKKGDTFLSHGGPRHVIQEGLNVRVHCTSGCVVEQGAAVSMDG